MREHACGPHSIKRLKAKVHQSSNREEKAEERPPGVKERSAVGTGQAVNHQAMVLANIQGHIKGLTGNIKIT